MKKLSVLVGIQIVGFLLLSNCEKIDIVRFGTSSFNELDKRNLRQSLGDGIARQKYIELPQGRPLKEVGENIEFELFDGKIVTGVVETVVDRGGEVSTTWMGSILNENNTLVSSYMDRFTVTCHIEACTAHIVMESSRSRYTIGPSPGGGQPFDAGGKVKYVLNSVGDYMQSGTIIHNRIPHSNSTRVDKYHHRSNSNSEPQPNQKSAATAVDTDLILDVGVIYTPEALAYLQNSATAMISQVYLATDEANAILERSQVSLRIRIVFIKATLSSTFTEPGDNGAAFSKLLDWLTTPSDGYLDEAQTWREQYQADFVVLVNECNAYGGLAWVNTNSYEDYAYANYNVRDLVGVPWMHEMSHVMGCYHDRIANTGIATTYNGFGNCWEDASKSDCTCYMSVMVYYCKTPKKGCTSCDRRPYLANMNVIDAGNPTGVDSASCGLHVHQNRYTPITYRKSLYSGGMIWSVSPAEVLRTQCTYVNITGWMLSNGDTITKVTLAGQVSTIVSQTSNSVLVQSPVVSSFIQGGDVVVTTSGGRSTTLKSVFTFRDQTVTIATDLSSMSVESTVWAPTGPVDWNIEYHYGKYAFSKADADLDTDVARLATTKLIKTSGTSTCFDVISAISFSYNLYSSYLFCYGSFNLNAKVGTSTTWTKLWSGSVSSSASAWSSVSTVTVPSNTRALQFEVVVASNTNNCKYFTQAYIADIVLTKQTTCSGTASCLGTTSSTATSKTPSRSPSMSPTTKTPSRMPTRIPSRSPSMSPTMIPSRQPTRTPSRAPSMTPTMIPSRQPTRSPSRAPSMTPTMIPSRQPTRSPSRSPTMIPSRTPTRIPTMGPTSYKPIPSPTMKPSLSPSRKPSLQPTTK